MNKNYLFGIGMALAMLLVFTAPAAADNVVYFDPDPSSAAPGEEITVTLWLNNTDGCASFGTDIEFDTQVVNITSGTVGDFPNMFDVTHYGTFVRVSGTSATWMNLAPGHWKLADLTLVASNSGTSTLHHTNFPVSGIFNEGGNDLPDQVWNDGTFTCVGVPETFTKSLPLGWNLISLPLTPLDSSTSAVLGNDTIAYGAVYRYDATSKQFVDVATGTMDPGTGYFVHVTTAGDWTYEGMPVSSTSPGLKSGLNMIGVPNCTMSVSDAMGSVDYRYVARWNAVDKKFEVYNPSAPAAFHHFTTMTAGEGYFVSAKSDDVAFTISCPS